MPETTLELPALEAVLPLGRPFTRAQVLAAGIHRAQLDRLLASGRLRRLLRGVYADTTASVDLDFRAEAARMALPADAVAARRTAAWVWGADVAAFAPDEPVPLARLRERPVAGACGPHVQQVGGLRLTTPLRTALDLGAHDTPEVALATMDDLVGRGLLSHTALLGALAGRGASSRLRALTAQVDGRALGPAESVLRLHWHASRLPTPVPAYAVPARQGVVRFALALPERRFGVVVTSGPGTAPASADVRWLRDLGWWVLALTERRVLRSEPALWCRHLEREWHQQLLADVG